ncbi:MAG: hypothetical protein CTY28_09550 [Hyphomicrobium sp.]|nr:MAG: hypothetical protein CTY28_09550 [Hyphomicrobium sp.]
MPVRIPHLTTWRRGLWRYVRAVPRGLVGEFGQRLWSQNLGRVSLAEAETEARALDAAVEWQIERVRGLSAAERAALVAAGGIAGLEAGVVELESIAAQVQDVVHALRRRPGCAKREAAASVAEALQRTVADALNEARERVRPWRPPGGKGLTEWGSPPPPE